MNKKQTIRFLIIFLIILSAITAGILFSAKNYAESEESIQVLMKNAVLHESDKINFFGLHVNPGFLSAVIITGCFLVFGLIFRFVIFPRFKTIPGKFQMVIEMVVGLFDNMAKTNSPHKNGFLGGYIFTAGAYIFVSTIFELFGVPAITIHGHQVSLPAPLSDINGAIMMGCLSFLFIMAGGAMVNGIKGILKTLKDFSLPISMSFRLFGALLSGALVTELVYYYSLTKIVFPVIVGVLFTLLHALIQAYVLTTLTSVFYGEVSEKIEPKAKKKKTAQAV